MYTSFYTNKPGPVSVEKLLPSYIVQHQEWTNSTVMVAHYHLPSACAKFRENTSSNIEYHHCVLPNLSWRAISLKLYNDYLHSPLIHLLIIKASFLDPDKQVLCLWHQEYTCRNRSNPSYLKSNFFHESFSGQNKAKKNSSLLRANMLMMRCFTRKINRINMIKNSPKHHNWPDNYKSVLQNATVCFWNTGALTLFPFWISLKGATLATTMTLDLFLAPLAIL